MLLYLSKSKMENLYSEFNINRSFIDKIMPNNIKVKFGFGISFTEGSIEGQNTTQDTDHVSQLLKKLKSKKALIELVSGLTYIKPLQYYICDGILSYEGRIDGPTAGFFSSEELNKYRSYFLADDKLKFKIRISHDKYKYVEFTCNADSVQTFGNRNLSVYYSNVFKNGEMEYHPNSADPGILERELPVRLIFWCLSTNESLGQVSGSPLIMSC